MKRLGFCRVACNMLFQSNFSTVPLVKKNEDCRLVLEAIIRFLIQESHVRSTLSCYLVTIYCLAFTQFQMKTISRDQINIIQSKLGQTVLESCWLGRKLDILRPIGEIPLHMLLYCQIFECKSEQSKYSSTPLYRFISISETAKLNLHNYKSLQHRIRIT